MSRYLGRNSCSLKHLSACPSITVKACVALAYRALALGLQSLFLARVGNFVVTYGRTWRADTFYHTDNTK